MGKEKRMNKLVKQYLEESYKYYITYEENSISDMEYDYLCKQILEGYKELSPQDKALVSVDSLEAGTGFDITPSTYLQAGVL